MKTKSKLLPPKNMTWDAVMIKGEQCLQIANDEMLDEWVTSLEEVAGSYSLYDIHKEITAFINWYNNEYLNS